MPSATYTSLADIPDVVCDELSRARRGVIMLAVDGLSYDAALAAGWRTAELTKLASTFPSTSTTAWLTAITGVGPAQHGVPGMVYRVPGRGTLVYAVTGRVLAQGPADPGGDPRLVIEHPTIFDRAAGDGVQCRAVAREIAHLPGPWAQALLRGATVVPAAPSETLARQARDPALLVDAAMKEVDEQIGGQAGGVRRRQPMLLWTYVNLDDYLHRHGYDERAVAAMAELGSRAARWAQAGWTVIGYSDHGQVRCTPDPDLVRAWSVLDDPARRLLPAGGAGRVRWLYPAPGDEDEEVGGRLAAALGSSARIVATDEALRDRVGPVIAIAADERFPVPDTSLSWEHGADSPDETVVPLAIWRGR
ncbi:alkaline phosphatase family protein [Solwaraspora sp. WMMA2065]|uniref:alkaline phosphatase family protein n=1 Tax=Solwaraspora sp. WMMA2065 TaxID=3015166 RepID=UPI00259AEF9F|nr:alkaline phosphatase family protein [Solwaraspora sp. WMMA2065]WJK33627.1 alkaline phosphatase family protein [Solwaraspora sp. WMMA2065]